MKITLENIAKVKKADVDIEGITVIAGENNTGKSTVGKALYSVCNGLYHIEDQIKNERITTVSNLLDILYIRKHNKRSRYYERTKTAEKILEYNQEKDKTNFIKEGVLDFLFDYGTANTAFDESGIDDSVAKIEEILAVSDKEILNRVVTTKLYIEFNGQLSNIYSDEIGEISLVDKSNIVKIPIEKNVVRDVLSPYSLQTEAVYIDDPFVLDDAELYAPSLLRDAELRKKGNHRDLISCKLMQSENKVTTIDEILADKRLEKIHTRINSVCDGNIVTAKRQGIGYRKKDSDAILDIKNISTGLKTFVILKTLLLNGTLEEKGTVILDEPEIHLHPQWQLLFAELIVLIQKEFNMNVLINTHSPYFLQAIETYAAKYEIADKCKYYLAHLDGDMAVIDDVSDSTEAIYKLLAKPFQDLENVRYEND